MDAIQGATLRKAQQMAEAFAKDRATKFTETFLADSDLTLEKYADYKERQFKKGEVMTLDQYSELLIKDYEPLVGQMIALAYAMGYMDKAEGKHLKQVIESTKPQVKF